jgi:hypothetical protein
LLLETKSSYNILMNRLSLLILLCSLIAGCQSQHTPAESEHDRISREIERIKAESEAAAATGHNIKIVVNMLSTDVSDRLAIDSLFKYVDKNVTIIKRPEVYRRSGLEIGIGNDNFMVKLDITKRQLKSFENSELFVVLADGSTGYINVGTEIAVPRFYYHGRWYSSVGYDFRQAGRSVKVTARRLPSGLVDIELTPVFSKFLSDGGELELTELSTRVSARPGQTLVIGGGDTAEENVAAALLSYHKFGQNKQTLITVAPHLQ